jgi:Uma2 family endonuclease
VAVEVSSPSSRRTDLLRKRDRYERYGVPAYGFVDLDADRVEVYRLADGRFGYPVLPGRDARLTSDLLPGVVLGVADRADVDGG